MNNLYQITREMIKTPSRERLKKSILKNRKMIIIISKEFKHLGDYYQKKNKKELMKVTSN